MRMIVKTMLGGALASLAAVALSGAANAANLGACGSSGANLLSNFVNANGTSNGNTCTVGTEPKTYGAFSYVPQLDFAPGGAHPVPASSVTVTAIADHTCQFSSNSCQGLLFTANFTGVVAGGDAAINFTVTAPTATIIDAELTLNGATGAVSDTALFNGGNLGSRTLTAATTSAALTFPGTPPTPVMAVSVEDDLNVPAGSAASSLAKQVSQNTMIPNMPQCTNCLSDSEEPGSVIVFPKFIQGSVSTSEGVLAPITELEIGVVCPKGATCSEHQPVKIRFHWVCGTTEADAATSFVCKETDFDVNATVFEKIVLTPNGEAAGSYPAAGGGLPTKFVPAAHCPNGGGYLIGWVIRPSDDKPVKFDGLIGDGVLRPGSPNPLQAGSPTALASYNAIPIQADPKLANLAQVQTNGNGALMFDGLANHYLAVTGQIAGDIRYAHVPPGTGSFSLGVLTLLTLDVKSNRPNNPVFVDLDFFGGNPSAIGNENQLSTSVEFICWAEFPITAIDSGLTTDQMGRKGVFVSAPAVKVGIHGIQDSSGLTSLLGLSETLEGATTTPWPRATFSNLFNSSVVVATHFLPTPSPNFFQ